MAAIPNEVKVTKLFESTSRFPAVWRVTLNGSSIGYIQQYPEVADKPYPWVATSLDDDIIQTFSPEEGYLKAVNAVVMAHFQAIPAEPASVTSLAACLDAYENGEYTDEQELELFRDLVKTGLIVHLHQDYQRIALRLLTSGDLP